MNEPSISEEEAIKQVRDWAASGDFAKAAQGCREILEVDPSNIEVKTMLAEYETKIAGNKEAASIPETTTIPLEPNPAVAENSNLQTSPAPSPIPQPIAMVPSQPTPSQPEPFQPAPSQPETPQPTPAPIPDNIQTVTPTPVSIAEAPITGNSETNATQPTVTPYDNEPSFSLEGHEPVEMPMADNGSSPMASYEGESGAEARERHTGMRIIAAVVAITLLGALGYYGYAYFSSTSRLTPPPADIISDKSPSSTPAAEATPEATPEPTPLSSPITPSPSPETTPEVETTPLATPLATPPTTPETSPESTPESSPEVTPTPGKVKVSL